MCYYKSKLIPRVYDSSLPSSKFKLKALFHIYAPFPITR